MASKKSLKKELLDISIKKDYIVPKYEEIKRLTTPTEEELELIRNSYYENATADNIKVFEFISGNTCTDRVLDELYAKSIDVMREKSVGKSFCIDHDITKVKGKIFDAYTEDIEYNDPANGIVGTYYSCVIKVYIPVEEDEFIKKIETGVLEYVSPSFCAESYCSVCGKPYKDCMHVKGKSYNSEKCKTLLDIYEIREISAVYLGSIRGAQRKKSFGGEYLMDFEKEYNILKPQLEELQTKVEDFEKKYDELNKESLEKDAKINSLNEILKVFSEDLTVEKATEINEYSKVGKEARENLVNDILRMDLVINKANGVETETSYLKSVVNLLGFSDLKAMKEDFEKRYENIPSGRQTADKKEKTVVKNKLFEY